jgi:CheY-like chemotaxis protein
MYYKNNLTINILIADDDPDDRILLKEAFDENFKLNIDFVENGEELTDYLFGRGKYTLKTKLPSLILLDLNMPRKDGREALKEIKSTEKLRRIPILIFSTSKSEEDIKATYDLGVNSFITKPPTFDELIEVTKTIGKYWFQTALLSTAT